MATVPSKAGEFQDDTEVGLSSITALTPDALNSSGMPADADSMVCEKMREELAELQEEFSRVEALLEIMQEKKNRMARLRTQTVRHQAGLQELNRAAEESQSTRNLLQSEALQKLDLKTRFETTTRQLEEQQNLRRATEQHTQEIRQNIPIEERAISQLQEVIPQWEAAYLQHQKNSLTWDQNIDSHQAVIQQDKQAYQAGLQKQQEYQALTLRYNSIKESRGLRQAVTCMDGQTLDHQCYLHGIR